MPNCYNSASKFNWGDYMSFRQGIMELHTMANDLYLGFPIKTMRQIKTYEDYFYAEDFNRIEENLETINKHVFTQDIGKTKTFYDNGQFIKYDELFFRVCHFVKKRGAFRGGILFFLYKMHEFYGSRHHKTFY